MDGPTEWGGTRDAEQTQDGTNAPGEPVHLRERPGLFGNRGRDAERHLDGQPARAPQIMAQDWLRDLKPAYDVIGIGSGRPRLSTAHRPATRGHAGLLVRDHRK